MSTTTFLNCRTNYKLHCVTVNLNCPLRRLLVNHTSPLLLADNFVIYVSVIIILIATLGPIYMEIIIIVLDMGFCHTYTLYAPGLIWSSLVFLICNQILFDFLFLYGLLVK